MASAANRDADTPFRAFYRGLTAPSGLSIFIAIVMAAAAIIYGCSIIDEDWVIHSHQLLGHRDDNERDVVTRRALELRSLESDQPSVILVGRGHAGRDPNGPERTTLRSDPTPAIFDLRTSSQTIWESLAICDQVPRDTVGKLVLYLSPDVFDAGIEEAVELDRHPDYGFRSASLAVELQKQGRSTVPIRKVYFLDNYSYLLRRLPFATSESSSEQSDQPGPSAMSDDRPKPALTPGPVNLHSAENLTRNLPVLESMLERLIASQQLDVSIVFDHPSLDERDNDQKANAELQRIVDEVRALAKRHDIELTEQVESQT